jgi:hypothetical protein
MAATFAALMGSDVDWTSLPDGLPAALTHLLRRCLEQDPNRRIGRMTDARLELERVEASAMPSAFASCASAMVAGGGRTMACHWRCCWRFFCGQMLSTTASASSMRYPDRQRASFGPVPCSRPAARQRPVATGPGLPVTVTEPVPRRCPLQISSRYPAGTAGSSSGRVGSLMRRIDRTPPAVVPRPHDPPRRPHTKIITNRPNPSDGGVRRRQTRCRHEFDRRSIDRSRRFANIVGEKQYDAAADFELILLKLATRGF